MTRFLLPIFFLLVPVGLFFTYIDPTYDDIQSIQAQASRLDEALTKSRELQAVRNQLDARRRTFSEEDIEKLGKLLPDNIDNIRLLLDINGIADDFGMQVQSFSFSGASGVAAPDTTVARATPYQSVVMGFSVSASYEDFLVFLKALERSLRIVDVTDISIASASGDVYTYNLSLRTYWLP
jgi:Tfp pilus assembly protein PilO